jgi:Flp pilus assembly protein TadD
VQWFKGKTSDMKVCVEHVPSHGWLPEYAVTFFADDRSGLVREKILSVLEVMPPAALRKVEIAIDFAMVTPVDRNYVVRHGIFGKSKRDQKAVNADGDWWGSRRGGKRVVSYRKDAVAAQRLEFKFRGRFLKQHGISDVLNFGTFAQVLPGHHIHFAHLDEQKLITRLSSIGMTATEEARVLRAVQARNDDLCATRHPRNAIAWVDLALAFTILGFTTRANRAISVALTLNPSNRFVLRSAAHLYIHEGLPDRAHHILLTAESTRSDPWLMAAELAVASAGNFTPKLNKEALTMMQNESFHPFDLAELGGAIATFELENGNHLRARNLFRKALVNPNENVVAQAEWASTQLRSLNIETREFQVPRLFEATAWTTFQKGDWAAAYAAANGWLEDQPFSSRPAALSSFLASVIFEDNGAAEAVLSRSLLANPRDPIILNNLAFAQASLGKVEEAEKTLSRSMNLAS